LIFKGFSKNLEKKLKFGLQFSAVTESKILILKDFNKNLEKN